MTRTEQISAMTDAMRSAHSAWERGDAFSPDARDLVYFALRAIGRSYGAEPDPALVDAFYEYDCEGHSETELAAWLLTETEER